MEFEEVMENVVLGFEAFGVAIIVVGAVVALYNGSKDFGHFERFFIDVRRDFGRSLILGLEVLVAADVIKTITVDTSLESVTVLGILVAVRIALSFALDIEVDGMVPWHRAAMQTQDGDVEAGDESGTDSDDGSEDGAA
jgi:uncharacterized membrane protein